MESDVEKATELAQVLSDELGVTALPWDAYYLVLGSLEPSELLLCSMVSACTLTFLI
jgi:hypothetical protein